MQLTSAMANKIIKKLHDENGALLQSEAKDKTTTYAAGETPIESVYSFVATHKKLWENNRKICLLRHAISKFNLETKLNVLGCTDMTIDQALVKMRMLTEDKSRLTVCVKSSLWSAAAVWAASVNSPSAIMMQSR